MPVQKFLHVHQIGVGGIQLFIPFDVGRGFSDCRVKQATDVPLIGANLPENQLLVVIRPLIARRPEQLDDQQLLLRLVRQRGKAVNIVQKYARFFRAGEDVAAIPPGQRVGQPPPVKNLPHVVGQHFPPKQTMDIFSPVSALFVVGFQRVHDEKRQPHIHHFQRFGIGQIVGKFQQFLRLFLADGVNVLQRGKDFIVQIRAVFGK